jgi:hypothetical protein
MSSRISLSVTLEVSEKGRHKKKNNSNHPQTKTDPPAVLSMIASLNGLGKYLALNETIFYRSYVKHVRFPLQRTLVFNSVSFLQYPTSMKYFFNRFGGFFYIVSVFFSIQVVLRKLETLFLGIELTISGSKTEDGDQHTGRFIKKAVEKTPI